MYVQKYQISADLGFLYNLKINLNSKNNKVKKSTFKYLLIHLNRQKKNYYFFINLISKLN